MLPVRFSLFCPDTKSTTAAAQRREAQKEPERENCSPRPLRRGDKGITAQTPGRKSPKARLVFLLDTRRRPRHLLNSPYDDPLAEAQRTNTRQHPGP